MGIGDKLLAKTANVEVKPRPVGAPAVSVARTSPGRLMDAQNRINSAEQRIAELTAELESARKAGGAVDIPLTDLHEVPGRRRHMPADKYLELRENLRHNKLIHPVVVRPRGEGGFEIVSGHHRCDAYRELGRNDIRCVLEDVTEDEASLGAFYANLLQSDLTDYEKYLGFRDIQKRYPGITQARMAEQAGTPPSVVSALMAFEHLPKAVLDLLDQDPTLLGANAGAELSALARKGRADKVVEAVEKLAKGEVDQAQAVKLASRELQTVKPAPKATGFKIRAGRSVYCDLRAARNVLRLEFTTEDEAKAVQEELKTLLEHRASQFVTDKKS
ncbi:ParB/RepB/Spo0J family partition protein [Ralstonia holmesii]|uniref:ParB/RepB/Spo0J family partition protein n=1 Tax=Ralstonia holmesii TaxID=3058602 RepID=UPI003D658EBA